MDQTAAPNPNPGRTNWVAFSLIALFLIISVAIISFLYFDSKNKKDTSEGTTPSLAGTNGVVEITKDGFVPAEIKIKKGGQITWINKDTAEHFVASDPHPTHDILPALSSDENLAANDQFVFTFEKAGTYGYHDNLNPSLKGTVVVE